MRLLTLVLLPLMVLGMAGCGPLHENEATEVDSDVSALVEESGEATDSGDLGASLNSIPIDPLKDPSQLATPEKAAITAAIGPTFFKPAGCVTVARTANVVTYTFKGCTGPFGLVSVNGQLVAVFTPAGQGTLAVSVKSDGLVIGRSLVQHTATGSIAFSGSKRLFSWTGSTKGVLARNGALIDHKGTYAGVYDVATSCVQLDGEGITRIGLRGVQTKIAGYKRCGSGGVCPIAGTISVTGLWTKLTITVEYLGNGQAELTTPRGKVFDYTMGWCTPL